MSLNYISGGAHKSLSKDHFDKDLVLFLKCFH